ncbi:MULTISPECIES: DUF3618 domain-containing protein [Pseudomonadaceae]|uniref:DUF3618 domain-containing protein n=1 Tax=Pseudomonadaceae TaxID=135621 RepID=UPI000F766DE0|nr:MULTISPECIES: DUF3618 domain-containing protein [Pseudomonadaceae]MBE7927090.1 DUF3618 domain-containing protein [Pseudomonas saudiphocaensis]MCF6782953.1 DUF3618 domain-containing protein [Stutzerimonas stutzeri]MCF6804064.1 DUF3618 domain-containing protein [Stutzerimonas stutzeri]RRV15137.1 DUF3618 domain-containing protein [Pseudomonas saudiphocaensis]
MSTGSQINIEAQKDPAELEREIDQKRAEIGDIVHALENKLSPGELIDTALSYVKGGGGEFFTNLSNTAKANPVPTVLTSIGLLWLMAGQNRQPTAPSSSSGPSLGDKLSSKASGLKQQGSDLRNRTSQVGHDVSASLADARHRVSDTSRHAAESLRQQSERARGGFNHLLNEQPLALGAIGIALGALLAASVPPTRKEDEMLGRASDSVTDSLRHKAEEGYQKASDIGQQVASDVRHEIKRDSGESRPEPTPGL